MVKEPQSHGYGPASEWVRRFAGLVRKGGRVLDIAPGAGRHARFFLDRGHGVVAIDRNVSGLSDLAQRPDFRAIEADLESGGPWPLEGERFAGIVVTNYLYRPLFPRLIASVEPGGVLIYETFARGNERLGKPRSPEYLLEKGELLEAVRGKLDVVAYEHMEVATPRPAVIQRICALRETEGDKSMD